MCFAFLVESLYKIPFIWNIVELFHFIHAINYFYFLSNIYTKLGQFNHDSQLYFWRLNWILTCTKLFLHAMIWFNSFVNTQQDIHYNIRFEAADYWILNLDDINFGITSIRIRIYVKETICFLLLKLILFILWHFIIKLSKKMQI